jgi:molybdopterin-guanine dinucleotide biosynthesis protein A
MTARLPAASGIVLAGGRSTRFGRDKLAEPLAGRPLLEHALAAVATVAADVAVMIPPVGEAPRLPGLPTDARFRVVRDPEPYGGPLVALLAGLERALEPYAVVVGGDMPRLAPAVLEALLRSLDADEDVDAVVLAHRGRRQPLPATLRVGAATPVARRVLADGERSLLALFTALRTRELPESSWRALDPTAATLLDVDRPEDLPG